MSMKPGEVYRIDQTTIRSKNDKVEVGDQILFKCGDKLCSVKIVGMGMHHQEINLDVSWEE